MTGEQFMAASLQALRAYAEPIRDDARATAYAKAANALEDALLDGWDEEVWAADEESAQDRAGRLCADALLRLAIPSGALAWAGETWREYYMDALPSAFVSARRTYSDSQGGHEVAP